MADIHVGKFINNLDTEDLTSEKLQGVVNNVYAKAISTHKKKQKEVEDRTKEQEDDTVTFVKSNHDRLKAHKNKPEKDIDKDDATAKDKVAKEINESFSDLSRREKVDYVINNYKKITGKNISDVYTKNVGEDDDVPIFDQNHIDATADRMEKFLKKNGMSTREIDDFYYDLDAELVTRYNELSVRRPKRKVNESLEDIKSEWENMRSRNMFEFPSGDYVYVGIDFDKKTIYAGGATNTGIFRETEIDLDEDDSLYGNLERLYETISEEHPEYFEINESFSLVDTTTGDQFGPYETLGVAENKARQYGGRNTRGLAILDNGARKIYRIVNGKAVLAGNIPSSFVLGEGKKINEAPEGYDYDKLYTADEKSKLDLQRVTDKIKAKLEQIIEASNERIEKFSRDAVKAWKKTHFDVYDLIDGDNEIAYYKNKNSNSSIYFAIASSITEAGEPDTVIEEYGLLAYPFIAIGKNAAIMAFGVDGPNYSAEVDFNTSDVNELKQYLKELDTFEFGFKSILNQLIKQAYDKLDRCIKDAGYTMTEAFKSAEDDCSSSKKECSTVKKFSGNKGGAEPTQINENQDYPGRKEFMYAFRLNKHIIFEVSYYTLGSNAHADFTTAAYEFNRPKSDWKTGGQAQEELLPRFPAAYNFWKKWDKYHFHDLTDEEYADLVKDLDKLKSTYKYTERVKDTYQNLPGWESRFSFYELKKLAMNKLENESLTKETKNSRKKLKESHNLKRNVSNVGFATKELEKKGYSHEEANDLVLKIFDEHENDTTRPLEWYLDKILSKSDYNKEYGITECNKLQKKVNEDAYDDYFGDKGVDYLIGLVKDIAKKGDLKKYNLTQSEFYEVWDALKELKRNRSYDTVVDGVANFIGENSNLLLYPTRNGTHIEVNNMYESKKAEGKKLTEERRRSRKALADENLDFEYTVRDAQGNVINGFSTKREAVKCAKNDSNAQWVEYEEFDKETGEPFFSEVVWGEIGESKTPYGGTTIEDYVNVNFSGSKEDKNKLIAKMRKKVDGSNYFNGLNMSVKDWKKAGEEFGLTMKSYPVTESKKLEESAKSWVLFFDKDGQHRAGSDWSTPMSVKAPLAKQRTLNHKIVWPNDAEGFIVLTPDHFSGINYDELQKLYNAGGISTGKLDRSIPFTESKELKEDWTVFEFTSGSNPYIAKTDKEVKRLLRKYKGRVEWDTYNGNYIVDDKERHGWDKPMYDPDPLPFDMKGYGEALSEEAKGKKVYVVVEIPKDSDVPKLIGVYSSKSAAEKVAYSEARRWCNVIETTLKESLKESIKERYKDVRRQAAYENACDCIIYGYGKSYWNSLDLTDKEKDEVWRQAFNDIAETESLKEESEGGAALSGFKSEELDDIFRVGAKFTLKKPMTLEVFIPDDWRYDWSEDGFTDKELEEIGRDFRQELEDSEQYDAKILDKYIVLDKLEGAKLELPAGFELTVAENIPNTQWFNGNPWFTEVVYDTKDGQIRQFYNSLPGPTSIARNSQISKG